MRARNLGGWGWLVVLSAMSVVLATGCKGGGTVDAASLGDVARERELSETDVLAAAKTYVPTGKLDDYLLFASGGHSGQVLVVGVPSMRLLKVIGVFTPEPWQGYGTGSEETGRISIANNGHLVSNLDEGKLRKILGILYRPPGGNQPPWLRGLGSPFDGPKAGGPKATV